MAKEFDIRAVSQNLELQNAIHLFDPSAMTPQQHTTVGEVMASGGLHTDTSFVRNILASGTLTPDLYPEARQNGFFGLWAEAKATGRLEDVQDVIKGDLIISAFELHCPKQDGATAKFSEETSRMLEAGIELSIGTFFGGPVISAGLTGSVKISIKGVYTAKNECVRYVLKMPALWQRVLNRNYSSQGVNEVRLLHIFEGTPDLEIVPITDCTCRLGQHLADSYFKEVQVSTIDLKAANGTYEETFDVEYTGKASFGIKFPFGQPFAPGKDPRHSITPKITLSGTRKLGYTYNLPVGRAYIKVENDAISRITWLEP